VGSSDKPKKPAPQSQSSSKKTVHTRVVGDGVFGEKRGQQTAAVVRLPPKPTAPPPPPPAPKKD